MTVLIAIAAGIVTVGVIVRAARGVLLGCAAVVDAMTVLRRAVRRARLAARREGWGAANAATDLAGRPALDCSVAIGPSPPARRSTTRRTASTGQTELG
jgi:hypothetical protein